MTATLLTAAEVCRELHIPGSTLSRAVKAGTVTPDARCGHVQLFNPASVPAIAVKLNIPNRTTTTTTRNV
jgi:hypothetical protein